MNENKTACFTWRKRISSQGHQNTIESDKKKIYEKTHLHIIIHTLQQYLTLFTIRLNKIRTEIGRVGGKIDQHIKHETRMKVSTTIRS